MTDLKSLYPEVREVFQSAIPSSMSDLKNVLERFLEGQIMPEVILPLASCLAVNGNPQVAIPVAAALLAIGACLRILDDLEDQDRSGELWEEFGTARAWNYASVLNILAFNILARASLSPLVFERINRAFIDTCLRIAAGQSRDLAGMTRTIEDYWLTIEMKSGSAYATACATGAMVGTDNPQLIQACGIFGHHLGLAIQIFNDMESIWLPDGLTDLQQGKITLPLLYGLQVEHPEKDELIAIITANNIATCAAKIQKILDKIDTKSFLIWAALKEREQALKAISICPNFEGKSVLESYLTGMFGDLDLLLDN